MNGAYIAEKVVHRFFIMRQVKQSVRKMRGTLDFLKLSETGNTFHHKNVRVVLGSYSI